MVEGAGAGVLGGAGDSLTSINDGTISDEYEAGVIFMLLLFICNSVVSP